MAAVLRWGAMARGTSKFRSPHLSKRHAVIEWIRTGKAFDGVVDFYKVVSDTASLFGRQAAFDGGDHRHPNGAGDKAKGEAVDLALLGK